ncbi:MAG: tetratricopeptide repeat protein [Nevskia sp.]|nr:tetratricopeptide repeat protein [Nevskia sp.]
MNQYPARSIRRIAVAAALFSLMTEARAEAVEVHVLSATVKDQTIGGAEVLVQKNGMQTTHGLTDDAGIFRGTPRFSADDPTATLIIRKSGYSTLVAKCPCNGLSYAISPVMQQLDGMRIVLNWSASPADLDAHLVYAGHHVYWGDKQGDDAGLDVDHTDGYGPETITIQKHQPGQRYIYAVHNYSDRDVPGSGTLERSRPQVRVYVGQSLVRSYEIDHAKAGTLWTVFAITENGELEDLDRYSEVTSPEDVATTLAPSLQGPLTAAVRNLSSGDRSRAAEFNHEGESAYHRMDYENAIRLFQQAIDLNPDYGQAYSNLGLTYEKAGDRAEALWANRKAIALASGADAPRVRASSYYNIARIYEASSEWGNALDNYRAAESERHTDIYATSIARMQTKTR